jgi:hypothetical protein
MVLIYDFLRVKGHVLRSLTGGVTYFSDKTADDNLLLARGLDGGTEVGVVPGVDLTIPADDGDVGVHFSNLREQRTIGAWNTRGVINEYLGSYPHKKITLIPPDGNDNGKTVGLAQCGVEYEVVVHLLDAVVTDGTDEANLVVDDE